MTYNYNGVLQTALVPELQAAQRGLYYADSLFESLRMIDGHLPLFDWHWERLWAGLTALGYDVPAHWNAAFFASEIGKIANGHARIRLTVWRSPGGLYRPDDNRPQFLIAAAPLPPAHLEPQQPAISIGLCQTVRLPIDHFSAFKTLNAARYVAAAQEAARQGWDDGLLLNAYERICEATSSNIFWEKDSALYTVPLSEGCVAGVMRRAVLEKARQQGRVVYEIPADVEMLLHADAIFLTNAVRGVIPVAAFYAGTDVRRFG